MPDILAPSLGSQNLEGPDFPPQIEFPKWDRPAINIPPILKTSQDMFADYPSQEIPVQDFSRIVNDKLTPEKAKDAMAHQKTMDQLAGNTQIPLKNELPFRTFKSSEAIRYKQNSRLWKKVGFNPEMPTDIMDAMYDHAETKWESIKNVFPKMWQTASFQFKNYFQEYGDVADAIFGLDSLINQQRFVNQSNRLKDLEELYPDYRSDKPAKWWQVLKGDFWEESGSSLGFTLGTIGAALLENVALTAATAGFGEVGELYNTPRKVFKSIADYYSLRRAYALVKGAVGAKKVVGYLGAGANIWRLTNGALAEAAFEGATNANDYLTAFKQNFVEKNGYAPDEQTMAKAKIAADKMNKSTILWETPFLMASNAAQFGNIIAPKTIGKILEKAGLQKAPFKIAIDGAFKATVESTAKAYKSPVTKYVMSALHGVKNSLWEGTEESYQALVTKSTADYYNDEVFNKDNQSLNKSLGVGFDYLKSDTGMKEFSAGFATGAIFQHVGRPFNVLARPKMTTNANGDKEFSTNLINKVLGIGMGKANKVLVEQQYSKIAKALNVVDIERVLKEEGLLSMIKDKKTMLALAKHIENNDLFNMQNTQNLLLNRMLFAGLVTGKIDLQVSKLKQFAQQDFPTLQKFFDLDENEYTTVEDKHTFLNNLKNFTEALGNKAKEFEKIYEGEKTKHQDTIDSVAKEHSDALTAYNNHINDMLAKYSVKDVDELNKNPDLVDEEDTVKLDGLREDLIGKTFRFYGVNEGVKASVFAQAGMMEDAGRAAQVIRELNAADTTGIRYTYELNKLFDRGYRDRRQTELEEKASSASPDGKKLAEDQRDAFTKLSKYLNDNFDNAKNVPGKTVAKLIQKYFYALQKELNILDNNTEIEKRIESEEGEQYDKLTNFIMLQKQHQENLNLLNYLSAKDNFKEYVNSQSSKLTDFFSDAIDMADEDERNKPIPPPAAPTAPVTQVATPAVTVAPPPVQPVQQTPSNLGPNTAYENGVMKDLMVAIRDDNTSEINRLKEEAKQVPVDKVLRYRDSYTSGILAESFPADKINEAVKEIVGEEAFNQHMGIAPKADVLSNTEQIAVDEINKLDIKGKGEDTNLQNMDTSLRMQAKVLADSQTSAAQKRAALREISDQLLAPATAADTGTTLGRAATEAIEALNYPAPVEPQNVTDLVAEKPVTPTPNVLQAMKDDINRRRQEELDTYNSGDITVTGVRSINAKYDAELTALEEPISNPGDKLEEAIEVSKGAENEPQANFDEKNKEADNKSDEERTNDLTDNLCPKP